MSKGADALNVETGPRITARQPGPTNRLWRALRQDELAGGYKTIAIILHYAEGSFDPREFDCLPTGVSASQATLHPGSVAR